jgi:hypothetical protein
VNLAIQEEHASVIAAVAKLLSKSEADDGSVDGSRSSYSNRLDAELEASGFLDAMVLDEYGPAVSALVVQEIAARPTVVEAAASSFVRPSLCPDWARPLAVIVGSPDRPARFLKQARSVLFLNDAGASISKIDESDSEPTDPFFAFPMARLKRPGECLSNAAPIKDAALARRLLFVATACELSGVLDGALRNVTEYVKSRRQFGRPIGSFQAVQHRLATCASSVAAGKWLARKAAVLGDLESALLAVGYLQEWTPRILYDLHQFVGAMGLTLEYPLYRWSYRAKLLSSDFGGPSKQLREAAETVWN